MILPAAGFLTLSAKASGDGTGRGTGAEDAAAADEIVAPPSGAAAGTVFGLRGALCPYTFPAGPTARARSSLV